jgi:DNA-binding XRE family transcriptional regulator
MPLPNALAEGLAHAEGKPTMGKMHYIRPNQQEICTPMCIKVDFKKMRQSVGMTQMEVAKRLGVTQPYLSRLEKRDDHLLSTINRYAQALGGTLTVEFQLPNTALNAVVSIPVDTKKIP